MDREKLISLLGRLPERGPLDSKVIEEVDCGSYLRKTIEYSVERGERVRAFLCMPVGRAGRLPGLFCFHQHAGNRLLGKSEVVGLQGDSDQAYAKELAERGYVTLATDAICFEDRCQDKESPDYNHVHQLHIRLIQGMTLLGKVLSDGSPGSTYWNRFQRLIPTELDSSVTRMAAGSHYSLRFLTGESRRVFVVVDLRITAICQESSAILSFLGFLSTGISRISFD